MSTSICSRLRVAGVVMVLGGCAGKGGEEDASSGATDPVSTGGSGTSATEVEPTEGATTGAEPPGMFGFICVELSPGEGGEGDVFAGTRRIVVTLEYEACLTDYYAVQRPEMQASAAPGAAVFASWQTRLCAEDVPGRAECEVEGFMQTLDAGSGRLSVTYAIAGGTELAGRKLLWGPGPLPEFAGCAEGLQPHAKLSALSGVSGLDEFGVLLWQVQSFADNRGLIGLDGAGCIQAAITAVD